MSFAVRRSHGSYCEVYHDVEGVVMELLIVGIGHTLKGQPYFAKLERVLKKKGLPYRFLAWQRLNSPDIRLNDSDAALFKEVVYEGGREGSPSLVFNYLVWMAKLFTYLMKRKSESGTLVLASRFDSAFVMSLITLVCSRYRYIYLDRDALHLSYKWPLLLKKLILFIEYFVAKRALFHVIPGESRNFTKFSNVKIVRNSPEESILKEAGKFADSLTKSDKLTIYINGWLTEGRGMAFVAEALKKYGDEILVYVAGQQGCAAAAEIMSLPSVCSLGVLSNDKALAYYYVSDLVISFYDPSIDINRVAEPNKWHDCLVTKTPFVTNMEIQTARFYEDKNLCFSVKYNDVEALRTLIDNLIIDKSSLSAMRTNIEAVKVASWDSEFTKILEAAGCV